GSAVPSEAFFVPSLTEALHLIGHARATFFESLPEVVHRNGFTFHHQALGGGGGGWHQYPQEDVDEDGATHAQYQQCDKCDTEPQGINSEVRGETAQYATYPTILQIAEQSFALLATGSCDVACSR